MPKFKPAMVPRAYLKECLEERTPICGTEKDDVHRLSLTTAWNIEWTSERIVLELIQNMQNGVRRAWSHGLGEKAKCLRFQRSESGSIAMYVSRLVPPREAGRIYADEDGDCLVIEQRFATLSMENLQLGSQKASTEGDGLGEGLKLAALNLLRKGYQLEYSMPYDYGIGAGTEVWTFVLEDLPTRRPKAQAQTLRRMCVKAHRVPRDTEDLVIRIRGPGAADALFFGKVLVPCMSPGYTPSNVAAAPGLLLNGCGKVFVDGLWVEDNDLMRAIGLDVYFDDVHEDFDDVHDEVILAHVAALLTRKLTQPAVRNLCERLYQRSLVEREVAHALTYHPNNGKNPLYDLVVRGAHPDMKAFVLQSPAWTETALLTDLLGLRLVPVGPHVPFDRYGQTLEAVIKQHLPSESNAENLLTPQEVRVCDRLVHLEAKLRLPMYYGGAMRREALEDKATAIVVLEGATTTMQHGGRVYVNRAALTQMPWPALVREVSNALWQAWSQAVPTSLANMIHIVFNNLVDVASYKTSVAKDVLITKELVMGMFGIPSESRPQSIAVRGSPPEELTIYPTGIYAYAEDTAGRIWARASGTFVKVHLPAARDSVSNEKCDMWLWKHQDYQQDECSESVEVLLERVHAVQERLRKLQKEVHSRIIVATRSVTKSYRIGFVLLGSSQLCVRNADVILFNLRPGFTVCDVTDAVAVREIVTTWMYGEDASPAKRLAVALATQLPPAQVTAPSPMVTQSMAVEPSTVTPPTSQPAKRARH